MEYQFLAQGKGFIGSGPWPHNLSFSKTKLLPLHKCQQMTAGGKVRNGRNISRSYLTKSGSKCKGHWVKTATNITEQRCPSFEQESARTPTWTVSLDFDNSVIFCC